MSKKTLQEAPRVAHDFTAGNDADLDRQIAAFRAAWEAEHGRLLAMDQRRSLGGGRERVTFRVRDDAPAKGKKGR